MTGEKKNRNKNEMLTLCVFPIYHPVPLPACIMYDCREVHGVIIGNTQSVSISFLFLFFFHQLSLYPIKIFVKCLVHFLYMYYCFHCCNDYTEFTDSSTSFFCKVYFAEEFLKLRELIFKSGEQRYIHTYMYINMCMHVRTCSCA